MFGILQSLNLYGILWKWLTFLDILIYLHNDSGSFEGPIITSLHLPGYVLYQFTDCGGNEGLVILNNTRRKILGCTRWCFYLLRYHAPLYQPQFHITAIMRKGSCWIVQHYWRATERRNTENIHVPRHRSTCPWNEIPSAEHPIKRTPRAEPFPSHTLRCNHLQMFCTLLISHFSVPSACVAFTRVDTLLTYRNASWWQMRTREINRRESAITRSVCCCSVLLRGNVGGNEVWYSASNSGKLVRITIAITSAYWSFQK